MEDSGTDSDLDSKPNEYTELYRNCSHCTDWDSDPYTLFLKRPAIRVRVRFRVYFRQCIWALSIGGFRFSRRRGYQPSRRGRQHTCLPDFPKNCVKLRKCWSVGGSACQGRPLGSATVKDGWSEKQSHTVYSV